MTYVPPCFMLVVVFVVFTVKRKGRERDSEGRYLLGFGETRSSQKPTTLQKNKHII